MEWWIIITNLPIDMKYLIWKTRQGEDILVKDMSDRHLYNSIKMLERSWEAKYEYACLHNDDHTTIISASDCMPPPDYDWFKPEKYDELVAVANSRGIKV